jgi:hypothetical protein
MIAGMLRTSGTAVRRVVAASALFTVVGTLAACGGESAEGGGGSSAPEAPSASESTDAGEPSGSGEAGSHADGECGGGEFETQVVKAAKGVQLTVPADWKVKSHLKGADIRLYPPNRGDGDGLIVVEDKDQTLEEAMEDVEKLNSFSEKTSEQDISLDGFDAGRMTTYVDDDGAFSVNVAATAGDGLRVITHMFRAEDAAEQAAAESCLSTLTRAE